MRQSRRAPAPKQILARVPGGGCKKETDCGGTKGQTTLCALQSKFAAVAGLHPAHHLATGRLDAKKEDLLCLPALGAP